MYIRHICCVRVWASVLTVTPKPPPPLYWVFTTSKMYCENNPNMMVNEHASKRHLNSSQDEKLISKIVNETKILFRIIIYTCLSKSSY